MHPGSNLGYAEGVNFASRHALRQGADYLWLLNNDTAPGKDVLSALVNCARETSAAAVASPTFRAAVDRAPRLAFAQGKIPAVLWFTSPSGSRIPTEAPYWRTDWASFASIVIPGDIARQRFATDGFLLDSGLFMYVEDVEFGFYCRSIDKSTVVAIDGSIAHNESASSGGVGSPRIFYYVTRNRIHVARKWMSPPLFIFYAITFSISRVALSLLHLARGRRQAARAVLLGLIDGFVSKKGMWRHH